MKQSILILKTGSALPAVKDKLGDFEDFIIEGMDLPADRVYVADFTREPVPVLSESPAGIIITGSRNLVTAGSAMQDRLMKILSEYKASDLPILGICYGHQVLAELFGGRVGFLPGGREIGTVSVSLEDTAWGDDLFSVLPGRFSVQASHRETVAEVPSGARCVAAGNRDGNHCLSFSSSAWGVQFHPEFNAEIMRAYISCQAEDLEAEGFNVSHLLSSVKDDTSGKMILQRFRDIVFSS